MRKRTFVILLAMLVLGLMLTACGDDQPPTQIIIVISPTPEAVTPDATGSADSAQADRPAWLPDAGSADGQLAGDTGARDHTLDSAADAGPAPLGLNPLDTVRLALALAGAGILLLPAALRWKWLALFLLLLASNFTGYLLPWNQIALWATTVGTSPARSTTSWARP